MMFYSIWNNPPWRSISAALDAFPNINVVARTVESDLYDMLGRHGLVMC